MPNNQQMDIFQEYGFVVTDKNNDPGLEGSEKRLIHSESSKYVKKLESSKSKKRVSNYIFKAPLRLFRNIILSYFKASDFLRQQVKRISMEINLTTFPKLVCLCQREGVRNQIHGLWVDEISKYLQNKKKQTDSEHYEQIKLQCQKMTQSLKSESKQQLVLTYWGKNVRHKDKLKNCLELVRQMEDFKY